VIKGTPRETSIKRKVINGTAKKASPIRGSFRDLTRRYFAGENRLEFAIEALLFAIIATISAWPIVANAGALNEFFSVRRLNRPHRSRHWKLARNRGHPTPATTFFRQRENLDTKLVAFSMLALCKTTVHQQTIGKLNANFCLSGCPIN